MQQFEGRPRSLPRERREFVRVPLQNLARIAAAGGDHGSTVMLRNISADGAFVLCDRHLPRGSSFVLRIRLHSATTSAELAFTGRVVRSYKRVYCYAAALMFTDNEMRVFSTRPVDPTRQPAQE